MAAKIFKNAMTVGLAVFLLSVALFMGMLYQYFGDQLTRELATEAAMVAQGVETITRKEENKLRQTCQRIEALIKEYGVTSIVLGYPKNMNDTIGERAEKTEEFKAMLERRTGLPVILWDERLTTVEADEILEESGVPRSERKKVIDKIAAGLILQSYLNFLDTEKKKEQTRE